MNLSAIAHYPPSIQAEVQALIDAGKLGTYLARKYPQKHAVTTDKALYEFTVELKNRTMKKSQPLSRVCYDNTIHLQNALGMHTFVSRVQGGRLKAKNEIRIGTFFKQLPLELLTMIVVHELAHLKEKEHNKAFYRLCTYMEPAYHQLEFDARLFLIESELAGNQRDLVGFVGDET